MPPVSFLVSYLFYAETEDVRKMLGMECGNKRKIYWTLTNLSYQLTVFFDFIATIILSKAFQRRNRCDNLCVCAEGEKEMKRKSSPFAHFSIVGQRHRLSLSSLYDTHDKHSAFITCVRALQIRTICMRMYFFQFVPFDFAGSVV